MQMLFLNRDGELGDSELQTLSGIAKAVQVLFSKFPVPVQK